MSIISIIRKIPKENWFSLFSTTIMIGLTWSYHFIAEFITLERIYETNIVYYVLLAHFLIFPIGAFISSRFIFGKIQYYAYPISLICITASLCGLVFVESTLLMILCLLLMGLAAPIIQTISYTIYVELLDNPKYNGRLYSMGMTFFSPIIVVVSLLFFYNLNIVITIFYIFLCIIGLGFIFLGRGSLNFEMQEKVKITRYIRKKENISLIIFSFLIGFFFTNTYTASHLILNNIYTATVGGLPLFVIILFGTFLPFSLLSGIIMDYVGRRFTILIGLYIQGLAFTLLVFITDPLSKTFGIVFPILLSLGFALGIYTGFLTFLENTDKSKLKSTISILFIFFGLGMSGGVVIDEILRQIIVSQPEIVSVVLIFALMTATIIVFQLKETKPSKEELEWKNAIQYILVLSKSGVPLYSQNLSTDPEVDNNHDELLLGGALVAVSSLIQEIAKNREKLRVVKQEGFSILFEEGEESLVALLTLKELNVLRRKLEDFIVEFEGFFSELLKTWSGDARVFVPTKQVVDHHFG